MGSVTRKRAVPRRIRRAARKCDIFPGVRDCAGHKRKPPAVPRRCVHQRSDVSSDHLSGSCPVPLDAAMLTSQFRQGSSVSKLMVRPNPGPRENPCIQGDSRSLLLPLSLPIPCVTASHAVSVTLKIGRLSAFWFLNLKVFRMQTCSPFDRRWRTSHRDARRSDSRFTRDEVREPGVGQHQLNRARHRLRVRFG